MDDNSFHRWNPHIKRTVALILMVLIVWIIYRFQIIIAPLVIAFLIAFILDPIVDLLTERAHLSRGLATSLVFLVLIAMGLALIATPVVIIPSPRQIAGTVEAVLDNTLTGVNAFLDRPLMIGEAEIDLSGVYQELSSSVQTYTQAVVQGTFTIAGGIAEGAFWLLFIVMASFYLLKDIDALVERMDELAPPGYRDDFRRLRREIGGVWQAFFRGQLLLAIILAAVTALVFSAIGVPFAWVMGLLAGIMAFIPNIGQIVAAVPPILMAFLRGSTYLNMSNVGFGVMVTVLYLVLTLVYNNVLVPRILGRSLRLHPLVVLIAAIVGGLFGGILGMLLAAPTLSTLRIILRYVIFRLYDRDPFVEPDETAPPPKQRRSLGQFLGRARNSKRQSAENADEQQRGSILERSRQSAIVMAALAIVPSTAVLSTREVARYVSMREGADFSVGAFVATVILSALILTVLASRFMYARFRQGRYYGRAGALRWAVFGALLAVLWLLGSLVTPYPDRDASLIPYVLFSLLEIGTRIAALAVSFWIAFHVIGRRRSLHTENGNE
jgi:predicted PurR-regulated permease PerM